tara:strand:+ start:174 stop:524 length:351 start_codon:yes stop_codon:yes gene_type:complete
MARIYNGRKRTYKKTFAEKYIDRAMNDGVQRSTHQVVDAIISYIENREGRISFAYVPHKGKVSHWCSTNGKYNVFETSEGNLYTKIHLCQSCDGTGYLKKLPCVECNSEEIDNESV